MKNLQYLYNKLKELNDKKRVVKQKVLQLRQELNVKWTPAKEYNNLNSKQRNPDLYEELVKLEKNLDVILHNIYLVQNEIECIQLNIDDED